MEDGTSSKRRINPASVWLLLMVASALFSYEARHGQFWSSWKVSVLRTWQEVGYWNLHGLPAMNPGGIHIGEKPDFYPGYRAFSLLPVYWAYLLTGNLDTALVVAYLLLTLVMVATLWWALGRNSWALLVISALCLSPGYVRFGVIDWDPVPVTMLIGIPVMMVLVRFIANPRDQRAKTIAALALLVAYSQMEWASVFALGIGWAACAVLLWPTKRRQFVLFSVFVFCLLTTSALALMWKKSGGGSGAVNMLAAYTIGPGGYDGHGMSWSVAFKRLGTASAVGLLPLWTIFLLAVWPSLRRSPRQTLIACFPLWAVGMEICVLRNDMAHHQWMPLPATALGILLSLYLLRRPPAPGATAPDASATAPWLSTRVILTFVTVGTFYCLLILSVFRANEAEIQSLVRLVATNTPRRALIIVGPDLAHIMGGDELGSLFDRKSLPMGAPLPPSVGGSSADGIYEVNSTPLSGLGPLVAKSTATKGDMVTKLLGWYRANVSRKTYHLQQVGTYYLYHLESH